MQNNLINISNCLNSNKEINLNSWPFVQALKILKNINNTIPEKGFILLETGYGPSGLPHIGTFCEIVRTSYIRNALKLLRPDIPVKIFVVSDDMDPLRKVPDNVPNKDRLKADIGKCITLVASFEDNYPSYGAYMNSRLLSFLSDINFDEYEFVSASSYYKEGKFNDVIKNIAKNYDKIQSVVKATIGEERQETYSVFMPIEEDGQVVQEGVISVNAENFTINYKSQNGQVKTTSILDGNVKMQWKCDFPMRWVAFGVDFEMFGKDVGSNTAVYQKIAKILSPKTTTENFIYEMFLDENGTKISKSKGNGIEINDWLKYSTIESLKFYMFNKPQVAKKLFFASIPASTDDLFNGIKNFEKSINDISCENINQITNSPVMYVFESDKIFNEYKEISISYSMIINIAIASNASNASILKDFLVKYDSQINFNNTVLNELIDKAVLYYNDFIKNTKEYIRPTEVQKNALLELIERFKTKSVEETCQSILYDIGKKYEFDLRQWFASLYEILLGTKSGPRMGSFFEIYGIENSIKLIQEKIA